MNETEFLRALPLGAFVAADSNADSRLDAAELAASTHPLMAVLADTSGDGTVSAGEAAAFLGVGAGEVIAAEFAAAATLAALTSAAACKCALVTKSVEGILHPN